MCNKAGETIENHETYEKTLTCTKMFEKTKKVVESMSKLQNVHKTCGNHKNH